MAVTGQFAAGSDLTAASLNSSSIPVVSATSDILAPFTGQIVFNTTDNKLYRYTAGSWVKLTAFARYERTGATPQTQTTNTDMVMQFPTTVTSSPDVVATGTGNSVFTVQPGLWIMTAAARFSAATPTREMNIAAGSTTWSTNNIISASGSSSFNCGETTILDCSVATAVTVGTWQSSGGSIDVVGTFGHCTHIALARIG